MAASQILKDVQTRLNVGAHLLVSLDREDGRYSAGDVIRGVVIVNFPQDITVKGAYIHTRFIYTHSLLSHPSNSNRQLPIAPMVAPKSHVR